MRKTEKLRLYATYTTGSADLLDYFLNNRHDDFEVILKEVDGSEYENFGTEAFTEVIRRKVTSVIETIHANWSDTILWSDIDIQFFRTFAHEIPVLMEDKDILFQAEHPRSRSVNSGFFIMKCNSHTLSLFEAVGKCDLGNRSRYPFFDQSALNQLLATTHLRWDLLDNRFYARSHGKNPPEDAILHHANCTFPVIENGHTLSSMALKLRQLEEVRKYMDGQQQPALQKNFAADI